MRHVALDVEVTCDLHAGPGARYAAAHAVELAFGRHAVTRDWRPLPSGYAFTLLVQAGAARLVPVLLARARLAAQREVPSATMRLRNVDPRVAEVA